MNTFVGLGYLLEAPKVVKEKGKVKATFIMVIRNSVEDKPIYVKCVAQNNIADLFYINRQKGNLFSFSGSIVSTEVKITATGSTFDNYVFVRNATLIDRFKAKESGMGFKEILDLFPPEAVIRRRGVKNGKKDV
jgi:hypothetical protein